ncbi:hypothetical protein SAMN04487891_11372 [Flagellimonas taeanensis]|uniref:Uncharacterized protein n=1 Tax=Flagellimonas taeanensis TaxID=1005926 RepID=A0A1M6UN65_9FLAO|nr:hypothetical protein SAMN04487891_11372 [Allomuricauda taeanensis]SHK70596.1 hypothetical protein SAMN05216293_1694 [Allomuricauda taeanensis]
MVPIFRLRTYQLVFLFYKTILLVSTVIAILLILFKVPFPVIIALKLVFIGLFFIRFMDSQYSKELVLYQNFGLSKISLLTLSFLLDLIPSVIIYLIFFP